MLGEYESLFVLTLEPAIELPLHEQLLAEPARHRLHEGRESRGREGQVCLEHSLELEERLVIEADVVHLLRLEPRPAQAKVDCTRGETRVVLLPRESFLLRGSDDLAVDDQSRGAVVIKGGYPEDGGHGFRRRYRSVTVQALP